MDLKPFVQKKPWPARESLTPPVISEAPDGGTGSLSQEKAMPVLLGHYPLVFLLCGSVVFRFTR
jgi:hypothetical protein